MPRPFENSRLSLPNYASFKAAILGVALDDVTEQISLRSRAEKLWSLAGGPSFELTTRHAWAKNVRYLIVDSFKNCVNRSLAIKMFHILRDAIEIFLDENKFENNFVGKRARIYGIRKWFVWRVIKKRIQVSCLDLSYFYWENLANSSTILSRRRNGMYKNLIFIDRWNLTRLLSDAINVANGGDDQVTRIRGRKLLPDSGDFRRNFSLFPLTHTWLKSLHLRNKELIVYQHSCHDHVKYTYRETETKTRETLCERTSLGFG